MYSHTPSVFQSSYLATLFILFLACQPKDNNKPSAGNQDTSMNLTWLDLFNGHDLDGWIPKITGYDLGHNYGNTFRVKDGLLSVVYDSTYYPSFDRRFGHLFFEIPYGHYVLKMEYRFLDDPCPGTESWAFKNSGVMIHAQPPSSMAKNQDFPICLEAQFLGGLIEGQERPTMNLCTPGTHVYMDDTLTKKHCIESTSQTFYGDQWVPIKIEVFGDSLIRHFAAENLVLEYTSPTTSDEVGQNIDASEKRNGQPLTSGYIALQSEGHPIQFRKIQIAPLSPL